MQVVDTAAAIVFLVTWGICVVVAFAMGLAFGSERRGR